MEALTLVAVALALLHLGFPLAYYAYLRARWLGRPWSVRRDPSYRPRVTVIVPTYNEAEPIESLIYYMTPIVYVTMVNSNPKALLNYMLLEEFLKLYWSQNSQLHD